MKYNYFTWWLSTKTKPLSYKIWRYIAFPVVFIIWVAALSAFSKYYWTISLYVIAPAVFIDIVWNTLTFIFVYKRKMEKQEDNKQEENIN